MEFDISFKIDQESKRMKIVNNQQKLAEVND